MLKTMLSDHLCRLDLGTHLYFNNPHLNFKLTQVKIILEEFQKSENKFLKVNIIEFSIINKIFAFLNEAAGNSYSINSNKHSNKKYTL